MVFVSVGEVDSALIKGPEELARLEAELTDDMLEYCRLAADLGYHAELRTAIGTEVVLELRSLCLEVAREFRHTVFFAGQLVFADEMESFANRFLHNHTAIELLHWLQPHGLSLVILPVRVATRRETETAMDPNYALRLAADRS